MQRWCFLLLVLVAHAQDFDRTQTIAPGIVYRERRFMKGNEGPFTVQILTVDPRRKEVNVVAVRANDGIGLETTSDMSSRYHAAAAINGGFFEMKGLLAGASAGNFVWNGRVLGTGPERGSLVVCRDAANHVEQLRVATAAFAGSVLVGGKIHTIDGVNRVRGANQLIAYTPEVGVGSKTEPGLEVSIVRDRVVAVSEKGDLAIPEHGLVLSASGSARARLEGLKKGARVTVRMSVIQGACEAEDLIAGFPTLIDEGKFASLGTSSFATLRHPRTAFALRNDGQLLFVTVDGRQKTSVGMTLRELAEFLLAEGAREAVNLDGGGSTTMVVDGWVKNSPSDGKERRVSDGVLIFAVRDADHLEELLDTYARSGKVVRGADAEGLLQLLRAEQVNWKAVRRFVVGAREMTGAAKRVVLEAMDSLGL